MAKNLVTRNKKVSHWTLIIHNSKLHKWHVLVFWHEYGRRVYTLFDQRIFWQGSEIRAYLNDLDPEMTAIEVEQW